MSEVIRERNYSPAAQTALDTFSANPEKRAEYIRRGLIATNNLGFHMLVFDSGPDKGIGQVFYSSLSSRACEHFERVRTQEPDLWREALAAHSVKSALGSQFFEALQQHG